MKALISKKKNCANVHRNVNLYLYRIITTMNQIPKFVEIFVTHQYWSDLITDKILHCNLDWIIA